MTILPFSLTDCLIFVITLGIITYVLHEIYNRYNKKKYNYPPGPPGWPIVGNALQMGDYPYKKMVEWSKIYGKVFQIKAGFFKMVVVSDYVTAHDVLVKQGATFAGRPHFYTGDISSGGGKDIVLADYGVEWQLRRKMASHAMRNIADRGSLERLVRDEINVLFDDISETDGQPTDPKPMISVCVYSIIASIVYGARLERDECKKLLELVNKAMDTIGSGLLADFFPMLSWIPTPGKTIMFKWIEYYKTKVTPIIQQHKESFDPENVMGFIDELLKTQADATVSGDEQAKMFTDEHLLYTIVDLFDAGTNTSIETMMWGIAYLATFPEIQRRLAREILDVLGSEKPPSVDDRSRMPYTEATLYEIYRCSTIVPALLPHCATEDAKIGDYDVEKGTMVIFNVYNMHYDESFWEDPEVFNPGRFIEEGKFVPPSHNFLPFGAGRRVCLGEVIAKQENFLLLAHLIQKFEIRKAPGHEDDDLLSVIGSGILRTLQRYNVCFILRE